jgi:hypothetical protein
MLSEIAHHIYKDIAVPRYSPNVEVLPNHFFKRQVHNKVFYKI